MLNFVTRYEYEAWQTKVQNGRPYYTPICNVGFYIEKGGFLVAAAKDARQRTGERRHDMAAMLFFSHKLKGEIVFLFLHGKPTKTNSLWKKMEEEGRIGFLRLC